MDYLGDMVCMSFCNDDFILYPIKSPFYLNPPPPSMRLHKVVLIPLIQY